MKKELYLLALIAAFVVLMNYFPEQSLKADDPITTEWIGNVIFYGPDIDGKEFGKVKFIGHAIIGLRSDGVVVWRKKEK